MNIKQTIARAAMVAAAVAIMAPAAQAQTSDPGNFSFNCSPCTTTGNSSDPANTFFRLAVSPTGTYIFNATASASDVFIVTFSIGDANGPISEYAVRTYDNTGSNSNAELMGDPIFLDQNVQYYVSATADCGGQGAACNLTLLTPQLVASPTAVPEPATVVLLGTGLLGVIGMGARRRRREAEKV